MRVSTRIWLVCLSTLVAVSACRDTSLVKRGQIALFVGSRDLTAASPRTVDLGFVTPGSETRVNVEVRNFGEKTLSVELPTLRPVDWLWAAEFVEEAPTPVEILGNVQEMTIGGVNYSRADLEALLGSDPGKDASLKLAQALITARAYQLLGIAPSELAPIADDADQWVAEQAESNQRLPLSVDEGKPEGIEALDLTAQLRCYIDDRGLWPVACLSLGDQSYGRDELIDLLEPVEDLLDDLLDFPEKSSLTKDEVLAWLDSHRSGDAAEAVAQALILARLTTEAGGDRSVIRVKMDAADAWLSVNAAGQRLPFDVEKGSAAAVDGLDLAAELIAFAYTANPYIDFDWEQYTPEDFPLSLETNDARDFDIVFAPAEDAPDSRPMLLVVSSTDAFGNDEIWVLLETTRREAAITVDPEVGLFINPSAADPVLVTFNIGNAGTSTLIVDDIRLEDPTDANWTLLLPDAAKPDWVVAPANDSLYTPLQFSVRCDPRSADVVPNAVVIASNDASNPELRVPLRARFSPANFEVSHEDQSKGFLDFIDAAPGTTTKRVIIYNEGPGNLEISEVNVTPAESAVAYDVVVQFPPTAPGSPPQVVNTPVSMNTGRTLWIDVTYEGDPVDLERRVGGTLVIDYKNPQPGHHDILMLAGENRPDFEVAPPNLQFHISAPVGQDGARTMVIYNNGNGALTIERISLRDALTLPAEECGGEVSAASVDFSLGTAVPPGTEVPAFSLLEVPVVFNTVNTEVEDLRGYVDIAYGDPDFGCLTRTLEIYGTTDTSVDLPTAVPAVVTETPTVGAPVELDGLSSDGGEGELAGESYIWYLVAKPADSKVYFNEVAGPSVQFSPDLAGTYEFELIVFAEGENREFIFSEPASIQVNVAAAAR